MSQLSFLKKMDRNTILVGVSILGIIIVAGLIFVNSNHGFSLPTLFGKSDNQIGKDAVAYINSSGLSQTPATLVSVSEEAGLVKIKIKIGTSSFDSYATKDGKLLFPQAYNMGPKTTASTAAAPSTSTGTTAKAVVKKSDKPVLEAFVVSSCPFGLQMQRAIADVVKNAPAAAPYITIKYIGSVSGSTVDSMHGPEEGAENLRQICIREEQPSKFYSYLACYMKKTTATAASGMPLGDSTGCQASTGINTSALNSCVTDPTRGLVYAQKDFDASTKYSVQGSPTLILNGTEVSEFDYGGRSSDGIKSVLCAGFNTQPSFCSTKLNTAAAATSFAVNYTTASAGSAPAAAANTNCAPAAQ